jgi:hypothetical protein
MSAFEEVAIVKGPTVMTSSSACATADVAKSMTKETAADLRMATPLRKLHDRRCQNRSNHAVCSTIGSAELSVMDHPLSISSARNKESEDAAGKVPAFRF